ncbi:MAG: hypothetical protein IJM41_10760 [Bacteroidales bacterium]|nr:hypothetical protein [Bacteroidales bacterium]
MVINVYSQYYLARACFSGVERRGALVLLISDSEAGMISYKVAVSFFPHRDAEDFAVSYDAYFEKEIYSAPGRRSKKREAAFLESLRSEIDVIAAEHDAVVDWKHPLNEARMG